MNRTLSPAALKCGVCFLVCAFLLHFTAFYADCSALKDSCLRLHIIASSDESADQRRKLLVRDAVLKAGGALFDGSVRAAEAEEKIRPALSTLEQAAEKTLRQHGSDETVTITVGKEYFPVRLTLRANLDPSSFRERTAEFPLRSEPPPQLYCRFRLHGNKKHNRRKNS